MPSCFWGEFDTFALNQTDVLRENKEQAQARSTYGKCRFCVQKYDLILCFILKRQEGEWLEIKYSIGRIGGGRGEINLAKNHLFLRMLLEILIFLKRRKHLKILAKEKSKAYSLEMLLTHSNLQYLFASFILVIFLTNIHCSFFIDKLKFHN